MRGGKYIDQANKFRILLRRKIVCHGISSVNFYKITMREEFDICLSRALLKHL
jgi:hypothetical protein